MLGRRPERDDAGRVRRRPDRVRRVPPAGRRSGDRTGRAFLTDFSSLLTQLKGDNGDLLWIYLSTVGNTEEALLQASQLGVALHVFDNSSPCNPAYPSTPGVTFAANTNTGANGVIGKLELRRPSRPTSSGTTGSRHPAEPGSEHRSRPLHLRLLPYSLGTAIEKAGTFTNTTAMDKALNSISVQRHRRHDQAEGEPVLLRPGDVLDAERQRQDDRVRGVPERDLDRHQRMSSIHTRCRPATRRAAPSRPARGIKSSTEARYRDDPCRTSVAVPKPRGVLGDAGATH